MGKEGDSNLVSLLSESLEPVVDMHNNDCVICSCEYLHIGCERCQSHISRVFKNLPKSAKGERRSADRTLASEDAPIRKLLDRGNKKYIYVS